MTELTPELNLIKGEDPDDTADYLTISLASSLDILDGLFNTTTGHNHSGAHQGGNLNFQNLTIAGTLTATGLVVNGASTLNGTLLATGATTLQSTLNVAGVTTMSQLQVTVATTMSQLQVTGANGLTVTNDVAVQRNLLVTGTITTGGRITSGTDLLVTNGNVYLHPSGDTLIQRAAADQLRVPSTVFFGPGVTDTYLQRSGPIGGLPHPLIVSNGADGLWILNGALTFYTPSDPQGGGQQIRNIKPSTRPAATYGGGEVNIQLRLYVDGDITAGSYVHGVSFITTSDMSVKQNVQTITDDQCIARVRSPVQVYAYEIPPPVEGGVQPTPTDIGFSAEEVYANVPEFAALTPEGVAVGVNYTNMAALLWGAIRNIDARLQAKDI